MTKLIALKRLRYPRGPDGKEYDRGDEFEALSERDVKVLTLVRAAQLRPVTPLRVAEPSPVSRSMQAEGEQKSSLLSDVEQKPRRTYKRRDMTSED